jgi:hypothetical protein
VTGESRSWCGDLRPSEPGVESTWGGKESGKESAGEERGPKDRHLDTVPHASRRERGRGVSFSTRRPRILKDRCEKAPGEASGIRAESLDTF